MVSSFFICYNPYEKTVFGTFSLFSLTRRPANAELRMVGAFDELIGAEMGEECIVGKGI